MDATENQWVDVRILNKTLYYYLWTMFVPWMRRTHVVRLAYRKSIFRKIGHSPFGVNTKRRKN